MYNMDSFWQRIDYLSKLTAGLDLISILTPRFGSGLDPSAFNINEKDNRQGLMSAVYWVSADEIAS